MAPTIAPSLLVRSRRAAAVFDNANMLYQATADALLSPLVADKSAALERALVTFSSLAGTTNDYEWILMANRHGIYNQGGPALGSLDRIERIVKLGAFVNSAAGFTDQPKVANGASELMAEVFGDAGKHARSAVGVPVLPLGAAVEVDAVVAITA